MDPLLPVAAVFCSLFIVCEAVGIWGRHLERKDEIEAKARGVKLGCSCDDEE